ncbi:hypothetical protein C0J52_27005, partial [Blattella germanica]
DIQQNQKEGKFVIVEFDGQKYPGVVKKLPSDVEEGPKVDCMLKMNNGWKLPAKKGIRDKQNQQQYHNLVSDTSAVVATSVIRQWVRASIPTIEERSVKKESKHTMLNIELY